MNLILLMQTKVNKCYFYFGLASMNYFDSELSYKKPIYASRKNSNLISPLNMLQKQYKQLGSETKSSNKRKKKKGKKSKSSIWLKSKLASNQKASIEQPLRALSNINLKTQVGFRYSRSQLRSAKNPRRFLQIKKVIYNLLIQLRFVTTMT